MLGKISKVLILNATRTSLIQRHLNQYGKEIRFNIKLSWKKYQADISNTNLQLAYTEIFDIDDKIDRHTCIEQTVKIYLLFCSLKGNWHTAFGG